MVCSKTVFFARCFSFSLYSWAFGVYFYLTFLKQVSKSKNKNTLVVSKGLSSGLSQCMSIVKHGHVIVILRRSILQSSISQAKSCTRQEETYWHRNSRSFYRKKGWKMRFAKASDTFSTWDSAFRGFEKDVIGTYGYRSRKALETAVLDPFGVFILYLSIVVRKSNMTHFLLKGGSSGIYL